MKMGGGRVFGTCSAKSQVGRAGKMRHVKKAAAPQTYSYVSGQEMKLYLAGNCVSDSSLLISIASIYSREH